MSSVTDHAASTPRPTIFISYSSEDRPAARALRDALAEAGLDVWYDENELGGGDAWDQKIRRQIRDCDYFMPMISASTERRKEGYFRREWRLACERTLDMADDVTFLLPVVIDGTSEAGARVPEKFLTVQWLRLPGGVPTPLLLSLAQRLAHGHHLVTPPSFASRPTPPPRAATAAPPAAAATLPGTAHDGPPPMPPFPHVPEKSSFGHQIKFVAEVIWWALTAGWMLFKRAPKWLRVLLTIWFVILLFSRCGGSVDREEPRPAQVKPTPADHAAAKQKIASVITEMKAVAASEDSSKPVSTLAQLGAQFAQGLADGLAKQAAGQHEIVAIPFTLLSPRPEDAPLLATIFSTVYGRINMTPDASLGLSTDPLPDRGDAALLARGRAAGATALLVGQVKADTAVPPILTVRLLNVADGSAIWTASYPLIEADATRIAQAIADGVLAAELPQPPTQE